MGIVDVPGALELKEQCRAIAEKYIRCLIRAPVLARAIQNGYLPSFAFREINNSDEPMAYRSPFQFLKNESTDEYLAFRWQPTVDGRFPPGIRMNMTATIPQSPASTYTFDMTPIFQVVPSFLASAVSGSRIRMTMPSLSSSTLCERSLTPALALNTTRIWTMVDSDQQTLVIDNLVPNTIYRACMRCRRELTDPFGDEKCEVVKTWAKSLNDLLPHSLAVTIISLLIIFGMLAVFLLHYYRSKGRHKLVEDYEDKSMGTSTLSIVSSDESSDDYAPLSTGYSGYGRVATIHALIDRCQPALLTSDTVPTDGAHQPLLTDSGIDSNQSNKV